jgi:hypothetical protein
MNTIKSFLIILLVSLLAACATIPQESVDLSTEVGVGLKKQYQSQVDLVNIHFSIKRNLIDEKMEKNLNKYFENLATAGTIELNRSQLKDIATDVMEYTKKNNAAKEELEKVRVLLVKQFNDNYLMLNIANSSITGLLQSAVTVKEARSEAFTTISKATDGKMDLDKVSKELDGFILKEGEEAGKTINLVDKVKTLISKDKNKEG